MEQMFKANKKIEGRLKECIEIMKSGDIERVEYTITDLVENYKFDLDLVEELLNIDYLDKISKADSSHIIYCIGFQKMPLKMIEKYYDTIMKYGNNISSFITNHNIENNDEEYIERIFTKLKDIDVTSKYRIIHSYLRHAEILREEIINQLFILDYNTSKHIMSSSCGALSLGVIEEYKEMLDKDKIKANDLKSIDITDKMIDAIFS